MRPALATVTLAIAIFATVVSASRAAEWRSEQPPGPGIGVPVALGEIGDIEFWAPNRGMLITAGNGGVPAGLFAFDGTGWYRYSTVCGGHEGRIAWAGPNEFWTISDQQVGQQTGQAPPQHISLCHFKDGRVVASYGEPVGQATSYLPMNAAACNGPSECWFGGERLPASAVNDGAFHLRWDGAAVTPVPSPTRAEPELAGPGRSVVDMARYRERIYESVAVRADDVAPGESASQPFFLHQIVPGPSPFAPLPVHGTIGYGGAGAGPRELQGFLLSGDESNLWAVSGAREELAGVTALRKAGGEPFVPLTLTDPLGVFEAGDGVEGLAAEPGTNGAWVSFRRAGEIETAGPARLTRIGADGSVAAEVTLPAASEPIGAKGTAGPIACPASEQCWMVTSRGWIFHLGSSPLPQDTDPLLHTLITSRPPDRSLPAVPPITLPEEEAEYKGVELPLVPEERLPQRTPALLSKLKQKLIGGRVLQVSFTLSARARVRLVASRKGKVVAQTKGVTLPKGSHALRVRLDPKRWPTKIDLKAHLVKKK